MRMEQIRHVLAIADKKTVSEAARSLFMSQPNLSHSLSQLEKEIGASLFRRSRTGMEPTDLGLEFIEMAKTASDVFDNVQDFCNQNAAKKRRKRVKLSVANQYFPFATTAFSDLLLDQVNTDYLFNFTDASFSDVIELVNGNKADLGMVVFSRQNKKALLRRLNANNLNYTSLANAHMLICLGKNNPNYNNDEDSLSLMDLKEFPIVIHDDYNECFGSEMLEVHREDSYNRICVNSRMALYYILNHTNAFSFSSDVRLSLAEEPVDPNLRFFKVNDIKNKIELGYINKRDKPLSDQSILYIDRVRELLQHHQQ